MKPIDTAHPRTQREQAPAGFSRSWRFLSRRLRARAAAVSAFCVLFGSLYGQETNPAPAAEDAASTKLPTASTNVATAGTNLPATSASPEATNPLATPPAATNTPAATNVLSGGSSAFATSETNPPASPPANEPAPGPSQSGSHSRPEFSSFGIISERNIFDPNRQPFRKSEPVRPRPRIVESFALVGVMSYDKGTFAFFDGTDSSYKKALKLNDRIAGYKVASISPDSVKLASGDTEVQLRMGMQLRREDEGKWVLGTQTESYASQPVASAKGSESASSASAAGSHSETQSGASGSGDALERIRERLRRQREEK